MCVNQALRPLNTIIKGDMLMVFARTNYVFNLQAEVSKYLKKTMLKLYGREITEWNRILIKREMKEVSEKGEIQMNKTNINVI